MSQALGQGLKPLRVMVIDGSSAVRHLLSERLGACDRIEVVGTAINARTALAKLDSYRPEILVVDLSNASIGGMEIVNSRRLKEHRVGLVMMVEDAAAVRRLRQRPELSLCEFLVRSGGEVRTPDGASLETAVLAASPRKLPIGAAAKGPGSAAGAAGRARKFTGPASVLAIGVSTGGPNALHRMLPMFAADFPVPILIVQHMPAGFTASLAESLDRASKITVKEAAEGDLLTAGTALLAPGDYHMGIVREQNVVRVALSQGPPEHSCRPAVDYMLRSVQDVYGETAVAMIMTGMGEDGLAGCKRLAQAGARVIAQDEATCTVFGMPRGLVEQGIADVVAPLDKLAEHASAFASRRGR
ncbi:MAG TPA: chemotaxis response regulator protein-glutamate methylesterase [bacterium]|nr:chemotaxis response regulator protein-glutamate methylesterase [bacterium]